MLEIAWCLERSDFQVEMELGRVGLCCSSLGLSRVPWYNTEMIEVRDIGNANEELLLTGYKWLILTLFPQSLWHK